MVQSKEVLSLKKQVRRLKAKLAAIKSKAVDDDSLEDPMQIAIWKIGILMISKGSFDGAYTQ